MYTSHGALGLDVKVDDFVCVQESQPGRNVKREQAPLAIPAVHDLGLFKTCSLWVSGSCADFSIMAAAIHRQTIITYLHASALAYVVASML